MGSDDARRGSVGQLVRGAREQRGLTLDELARLTRLTPGALSHIETGRRLPDPKNALAIAQALSIPEDEMLAALDDAHAERRYRSLGYDDARSAGLVRRSELRYSAQPIERLFAPAAEFAVEPLQAARPTAQHRVAADSPIEMRHAARWSENTAVRIDAIDALADQAAEAIRTLRGLTDDEDPVVAREARRLLRELDVSPPAE